MRSLALPTRLPFSSRIKPRPLRQPDNRLARTNAGGGSSVVFVGPSLPIAEAARLLQATFRPPAQRGDIYRALLEGFTTIVLIDGQFHGCPSVWQRELLEAIAEGAAVYGASSMGAIRAAELYTFGMIGCGRVFEWYRDGSIEGDDEVALTYGPAELGYPMLSEPQVNIRATLDSAVPEFLTSDERRSLLEWSKSLYYPERSLAALLNAAVAAPWSDAKRAAFANSCLERRIDQKRLDAVEVLLTVAEAQKQAPVPIRAAPTDRYWRRARLTEELREPSVTALEVAQKLIQASGMSAGDLGTLRRELSTTFFAADWARRHNVEVTAEDAEELRASFPAATWLPPGRAEAMLSDRALVRAAVRRRALGSPLQESSVAERALVLDWIRDNGIDAEDLQGDGLVSWVIDAGPGRFGYWWDFNVELIDALRLLGRRCDVPRAETI